MSEWAAEVVVDEATARRLLASQFPELDAGRLELFGEGWDMTVWRAGEHVFRFPRREVVVPGLLRELEVLPRIAADLPLRVPEPRFVGRPEGGYPWPFYGAPLIPGQEVGQAELTQDQRDALAPALGEFLRALHGLDAGDDLPVDPLGRGDPAQRVPRVREVLARLAARDVWQAPPAVAVLLADAEGLPSSEERVLAHGDLHLRHLLVEAGRASGVIDWIDVCQAPRAIDLPLYWSLLSVEGRREFLRAYGRVAEGELLRARVLAFNLCGVVADYAHTEGIHWLLREAVRSLDQAASD